MADRVGLAKGKILERPMQGWVGYIEKLRSTFTKSGLPGGVAEKNSFSPGWKLGQKYPVYMHPGLRSATY